MTSATEMDVDVPPKPVVQPRMSKSPALAPISSPPNGKQYSVPVDSVAPALPPSPISTTSSASALASLLSTTLAQVESLKEKLKLEKRRADHFEVLASEYKDLLGEGVTPPENEKKESEDVAIDKLVKNPAAQLAAAAERITQLRESVSVAEQTRDEEIARRIAITDRWAQLNQYIDRLENAGRDVRAGFDKIIKQGGGVIHDNPSIFKEIPQLSEGELMRVDRNYNANGVLQPVSPVYSRRHDYPREERHGTRRPRSGSMDTYAYALGPNSKRVRYQDEHLHHQAAVSPTYYPSAAPAAAPPPPGAGHSLPPLVQQHPHVNIQSMPFAQGQPPQPLSGAPPNSSSRHRDRRNPDPAGMPPPDHQGNMYPVPAYDYRSQDHPGEYRNERPRRRRDRSRSYSHGRSPSRGSEASMDLDEMLLATTSDEQHLVNGNGIAIVPGARRKDRPLSSHGSGIVYDPREGSQFIHHPPPPNVSPHSQHLTVQHPPQIGGPPLPAHVQYVQAPPGHLSPPSSRPGSSRRGRELRPEPTIRDDLGERREGGSSHILNGQVQQYQTHVFAPVQTGAPVKKSKNANVSSGNIAEESHPRSPAPNPAPANATATTNALPLTSVNLAPTTSPFPPTNEQGQRICRQCGMAGRYKDGKCVEKWGPGPMGPGTVCDRCRKKMKRVERRGTIEQAQLLAAQQLQAQNRSQANIGGNPSYGNFNTPQRDGSVAKIGRTETLIVDSGGRNHFEDPAVSSMRSTSANRATPHSGLNKSSKVGTGSRSNSKAASRAGSIVDGSKGSRRSSPVPSSRLGTSVTTAPSRNHRSNSSDHSGSGSGMDVDADADGDAEADLDDAEAEVEGDIAALVDQAASSPPRPHPGTRKRNEDDVDIAALAGVDDDPDDYDSPATTSALKRQQAARPVAPSGVGKSMGELTSGPSPSSADGDAELDILEAVDAAEANSASSSSGMKAEDV